MDLVAKDNTSLDLVGRDEVLPHNYPPATVPAARAEIWKRNAHQPASAAEFVGVFTLGLFFELDFDPRTDRNVLIGANPLSASGTPCFSRKEDFIWAGLAISRETVSVLGNDEHVPTVTKAPGIAAVGDGVNEWLVLTPDPDEHGATLTHCEVRVEKSDDPAIFIDWPFYPQAQHRVPQTPYPAKVSYRLRNQSAEDNGGGRGWSAWSPETDAPEMFNNAGLSSASEALADYEYNEFDSRAGIEKGLIQT